MIKCDRLLLDHFDHKVTSQTTVILIGIIDYVFVLLSNNLVVAKKKKPQQCISVI